MPVYLARMWYILSVWPDNYMLVYSILLWIFCISGVISNGLVLYICYKFKELRYGLHMIMMMIFYDLVHNLAGGYMQTHFTQLRGITETFVYTFVIPNMLPADVTQWWCQRTQFPWIYTVVAARCAHIFVALDRLDAM